ncbi:MAG: pyridoxal-dependent decarboxylase [Sandaracinaceae bacterium]
MASDDELAELLARALDAVETLAVARTGRVSAGSPGRAARRVAETDLSRARTPRHAISELTRLLTESGVRTNHRRHFGWMNPSPHPAAAVADLLVSFANPQLATRALSPGPVEVERRLVSELAARMGLGERAGGSFTGGGSEANATALVCALVRGVPGFAEGGLAGAKPPVVYLSEEGHDSVEKLARAHGLGRRHVRWLPTKARRLSVPALARAIDEDRAADRAPTLVVSTAGTTNFGAVDPLAEVAALCAEQKIWHHVDAAWGGMAALSPRTRPLLAGVELADSVSLDPHKGLGAPLGTGVFLVRDAAVLEEAFDVQNDYGPGSSAPDPFARSLAWSRRFVGARLWLPLLQEGWPGLAARVERMFALTAPLRHAVERAGFTLLGPEATLPVVCFRDPDRADDAQGAIARFVEQSGEAWIARTRVDGRPALRACVCSHDTDPSDVEALGALLARARHES